MLNHPNSRNERKYKLYRNKLIKVIKCAKKNHYEQKLKQYKDNIKLTWNTINEILRRKKKRKETSDEFKCNGNKIINEKEIADKFNEYFINVGPNLAKKIQEEDSGKTYASYLNEINNKTAFINPTNHNEIELELLSLNQTKSCGYDEISPKIAKQLGKHISKPLAHIFNLSFQTGILPEELKTSLVVPVYKSGEHDIFSNYRPISILPCFSKILEKLMYKRIIAFFNKNDILNKHQYGFRKKQSTNQANHRAN